jgi:predicted ribosomally synthesized peptide with SipW-like signal peptide
MSLLVLGGVTSVVGFGTFASFTATTDNPGNVFSTGTLTMSTSSPGTSFTTLSNMIPGDSRTDHLTIQSTGSEDMTYTLTTTASASSLLDTSAANGLQLYIQRCSVPWTGTGPGSTCSGTAADVVGTSAAPVAVIGSARAMGNLCDSDANAQRATRGNSCANGSITVMDNDYLKVRTNLPTAAPNTFQGLTSTIVFTWDGTQVAGGSF